ncbi:hypothetical protein EVAR_101934_1 [Eumeta japonica]|uniref:Uncharacterized protein n=1 Tax=Eumeta variegata TaxID=151549 RepID=A0A4C1TSC5_EUMVA|nr:hypothetical protein EVAR_101934_1 [Eumeta japonica]
MQKDKSVSRLCAQMFGPKTTFRSVMNNGKVKREKNAQKSASVCFRDAGRCVIPYLETEIPDSVPVSVTKGCGLRLRSHENKNALHANVDRCQTLPDKITENVNRRITQGRVRERKVKKILQNPSRLARRESGLLTVVVTGLITEPEIDVLLEAHRECFDMY